MTLLKAFGCTVLTLIVIFVLATIEYHYTHGAITLGITVLAGLATLTMCFYAILDS